VKKKRFSVEQIVAGDETGRGWGSGGGADPEGRDQRADLLSLEEAVRRDGTGPGATDEAASGRKQPVEATGSGAESGQDDVAGCAAKKVLRPSGPPSHGRSFARPVWGQ